MNEKALKYWNSDVQDEFREVFTDAQLAEIEKLVSKKLPVDLKTFLKQYGGVSTGVGYLDDPVAFFVVRVQMGTSVSEYSAGFSYFTSHEEMVRSYTILTGDSPHFDAGPRIPELMLPINNPSDNDMLLLDLSDKNYGKIWYWKAIEETWGSEDNNMLGYVAKSFTDFINSLGTWDEIEQLIIERGGEPTPTY